MFNKKHKIGDAIAKLRKEKGWTQIELAEKLQVSDKAISKWESNKGDPSIEFLPAIAELFDVTLDYLMTGKEQKEKIVTMSKLELCAKKDNVILYKEIGKDLKYRDENNKSIFDYIFKYESKELFKSLLPNAEHYISGHNIEFYENFYYMRILCNDMSVVRDLIRLEYIHTTLNNHIGETYKNIIGYNGSRLISIPRKIISDRIIDMILYSKNIDTSIKSAMFTNHKEQNYISPALLYPYFVLYALKKNDFVLVKELLENAVKINQEVMTALKAKVADYPGAYLSFKDTDGQIEVIGNTSAGDPLMLQDITFNGGAKLTSGYANVNEDVIIPSNQSFTVNAGTTLTFTTEDGTYTGIINNGNVIFDNNNNNVITVAAIRSNLGTITINTPVKITTTLKNDKDVMAGLTGTIINNSTLDLNGTSTNNGKITNEGIINLTKESTSNGEIVNNKTFNISSTLTNNGTITNNDGAILLVKGDGTSILNNAVAGVITNLGDMYCHEGNNKINNTGKIYASAPRMVA